MIRTLVSALTLALLSVPVMAQDSTAQDSAMTQDTSTTQDTTMQDTATTAPASGGAVASASAVNGTVQVNQGEQFVPLQSGQPLRAGDRIMAMADGSATILFTDGCTLVVAPETMVELPATSTCAGGIATAQAIAPSSTEAVGSSTYEASTTTTSGGSGYEGVDWTGAAIVAGTVLVGDAILWNSDDNDNEDEGETVSP